MPPAARTTPSLDQPTLLDASKGKYAVTLYPQAGEASIVRVANRARAATALEPLSAEERAARSAERAARRAKGQVRRYCRANRCRFLWTLTYRQACRTWQESGQHLDAFLRRVRDEFGHLPIVAVCEPHPGGHGWHWHFGTDRRLPHARLAALWGHGYVWVGDGRNLKGRVPVRKLAHYLAKYLAKSSDGPAVAPGVDARARGEHRYRVTQGFAPTPWRLRCASPGAAYTLLILLYGEPDQQMSFAFYGDGPPDGWWLSFGDGACHGPPAAWEALQ